MIKNNSFLLLVSFTTSILAIVVPDLVQVNNHGIPGAYCGNVVVADINGDSLPDVILPGSFHHMGPTDTGSAALRIYKNISKGEGDINFEFHQEFSFKKGTLHNNWGYGRVVVGDYDNDGDVDIFGAFGAHNRGHPVCFTNSNGVFTKYVFSNSRSGHIAVGDLDNDNYMEFLITCDGGPFYYSWNGSSWIGKQSNFSHRMMAGCIWVGDLNGDNFLDIVAGGNGTQFGTNSSTNVFSQWHKNDNGTINASPTAYLSTFAEGTFTNGQDNGSYVLDDFDKDGNLDIGFAGSHEGFSGPPGSLWAHYDFFILYNKDGTGKNFTRWENDVIGNHSDGTGSGDGGAGNTEIQNITSGDVNGDGYPDIFFMGHHRHRLVDRGYYIYESRLFLNTNVDGVDSMVEIKEDLPDLGRGCGAFADFDRDGRMDLIFNGAELAWHSNGKNGTDNNNATTIKTYIYRNLTDSPGYYTSNKKNVGEYLNSFSLSVTSNPVFPRVAISYSTIEALNNRKKPVTLSICNVNGKIIQLLKNNDQTSVGQRVNVTWDATGYPPGVYFAVLKTGSNIIKKRFCLIQ